MLISLYVQNFAIIDNIQVEFNNGMTVLTGETGAGKSLIIDAIGLLFGNRASSDLIRFGEEKAIIEGVFSVIPENINEYVDIEDDILIIRREILSNGKSICKVNNRTITLSQLSEIAENLGDIHSQFDTQRLFYPKNYLQFIDTNEILEIIEDYKQSLKIYNQKNREYQILLNKNKEDNSKIEFLKYQISELEKSNISVEEEEELKQKSNYLLNFENITKNLKEIDEIFNEQNSLDNIYNVILLLSKLENIDNKYFEYKQKLEEAYYQISDLANELKRSLKSLDFDQAELDFINERLGLYSDLKRKYKKNTSELIEYYNEINNEIKNIENFDFLIQELEKTVNFYYNKTLEIAKNIREKRIDIARTIEKEIKSNLEDLQLKNTRFEISFNNINKPIFFENGIDEIDFLVSFNIGEPLKSLSKTASGGELSRFMLAFKSLISERLKLQTIVFDEIDSGVSGSIAYSIANKIKNLSKKFQILCVTHLPQVAAIADNQLHISKSIANNRTQTIITKLSEDERVIEIAKMISNGVVTLASNNLAKELLKK